MKHISKGFIAIALIALMAAGCSNSADTNTNNTNNSANTETPVVNTNNANTPASTQGTTKTFDVVGDDFKFNPAEIKVKEGDTVVINFSNPDSMPHDWVVDEIAGAKTKILNKDQSETITFVANKKGTFEYYCSVGQHRERGMVGKLIVE